MVDNVVCLCSALPKGTFLITDRVFGLPYPTIRLPDQVKARILY